ncbi:hypothetical protein HOY80DRAFT_943744 [Tuber brumale]|nr:hypothetical protein HOY80DRAFT_943744 [Tuber brumale]
MCVYIHAKRGRLLVFGLSVVGVRAPGCCRYDTVFIHGGVGSQASALSQYSRNHWSRSKERWRAGCHFPVLC